mmetsp:Transcript_13990/g.56761  ORF Transcript_13990/g.56761 Transcript_13990/m.56761 type:complete len:252 (+) Transcript_13990:91-846(+)
MADKANRLLEDRARQAEALQQSCAFSHAEIKQTLRARARYEYALKRRRSTAAIFGRYIKFEIDLYEICRMRQAAAEPLASTNVTTRGFMTRNILNLFQRALQKFRGNVGLWLEFATFSYSHASYRLLSEILSQALQFNPDCAGLWAFAATLEYRQRGDISAARRLLLRGSRSCDYCPALSQEYLRLELAYLINFEQRRLFLGIRDKKDFVDKAVWTCSVILFLFIFFVIMKMLTESSCTSYNELCIAQAPR